MSGPDYHGWTHRPKEQGGTDPIPGADVDPLVQSTMITANTLTIVAGGDDEFFTYETGTRREWNPVAAPVSGAEAWPFDYNTDGKVIITKEGIYDIQMTADFGGENSARFFIIGPEIKDASDDGVPDATYWWDSNQSSQAGRAIWVTIPFNAPGEWWEQGARRLFVSEINAPFYVDVLALAYNASIVAVDGTVDLNLCITRLAPLPAGGV